MPAFSTEFLVYVLHQAGKLINYLTLFLQLIPNLFLICLWRLTIEERPVSYSWMIFCCCCLISSEPKPLVSSGSSRSRGLGTPLLAPLILKLDFTPASEGPHSARERLGIMMNRQAWLLCCLHTSPRIHSFLTDSLGLISPPKRLRSTPIFLYFLIFCTENSLAFLADFLKYEKLLTEPCL